MDPQKLSQLDPKLRDAYQRVMGTPIPQPQAPQSQPVSQPQPAITPEPPVQPANFVQMNSEVVANPSSQNFTAPMPAAQTMAIKKKKGMMMPILFGIAGFILIAVYTFFWTKIFNFKLPFLP